MDELKPALDLIKKFEGCELKAYRDPVGIWTIGWGHTANVDHDEVITQEEADSLLFQDVATFEAGLKPLLKVPYTQNELCSFISFAYNVGLRAFYHSTLLLEFNRGMDKATVAEQFLLWTHAGGRVLTGLVERRKEEARLFLLT